LQVVGRRIWGHRKAQVWEGLRREQGGGAVTSGLCVGRGGVHECGQRVCDQQVVWGEGGLWGGGGGDGRCTSVGREQGGTRVRGARLFQG